jgi:hypothetical protein
MALWIIGIALVVVVGGGLLVLLLAGGMGKAEKRTKRLRYSYSEKAQEAAGKSAPSSPAPISGGPILPEGVKELSAQDEIKSYLGMLDPPANASPGLGVKGPDPKLFGKRLGKKPLKIDRRFIKGKGANMPEAQPPEREDPEPPPATA